MLAYTKADAVMIGRAGQGAPWLYGQVARYLHDGVILPAPTVAELTPLLLHHLQDHYAFYGEYTGVRTARKHLLWYFEKYFCDEIAKENIVSGVPAFSVPAFSVRSFLDEMLTIEDTRSQYDAVEAFLDSRNKG